MFLYYLTQFLTFNLTLNYKYTQKCILIKTWKTFGKPGKFFEKTSGNPAYSDLRMLKF